MTKEKLINEIEFKKKCIFYTERLIKDPPNDFISQIMTEQAARLKTQLAELEAELAKFKEENNKKTKKKQTLRKQNKNKRRKK
jgi:ABC-type proline/glycine betaine transport system ATPase subunit